MAYTITISSTTKTIETDTLQLVLIFNIDLAGTNTNYTAEDIGIRVLNWGSCKWEYDFEDAKLMPGEATLTLGDMEDELFYLFFGGTTAGNAADKQAQVKILLNGTAEFIGYIREDSLNYNKSEKKVSFTADPKLDLLNRAQLFDGNTPIDYGMIPSPVTDKVSIIDILEKTYQVVNPSISYAGGSLEINQGWKFQGIKHTAGTTYDQINFDELKFSVQRLLTVQRVGINSLGDMLRDFALTFGSYTGMIHYEKAFFKQIYHYDASYTQSLGKVLSHEIEYPFELLDYIYAKLEVSSELTEPYSKGDPGEYLERSKKEFDLLTGFWGKATPPYYGTLVEAIVSRSIPEDGTYSVNGVSDGETLSGAYVPNGELLVEFLFGKRNNIQNTRADNFKVLGLDYHPVKNFPYDGSKYQILSLEKFWADYYSKISALYLGAL